MKYKTLSSLIGWIFPTKQDRQEFRYFCKAIDSRKNHAIIEKFQNETLKNLQKKFQTQKLKVVFLNSENAKWAYQTLYEAFDKNPKFDVQVLVTLKKSMLHNKIASFDYKEYLKNNYEFFKQKGMNVDYAFNIGTNEFLSLQKFGADIVFYEQPWQMPKAQSVLEISRYALPFYTSYGSTVSNGDDEYTQDLYKDVYTYFVDNEFIKIFLIAKGFDEKRLDVSGQFKLDAFLKPVDETKIVWDNTGKYKKRIIWAPHHSFAENSTLRYGTFHWNYKFMLEYIKNNPDYEFILKPHPALKSEIITKHLMSEDEMNRYFDELKSLSNVKVYDKTDYFDMFRTSDLMITDCCSFLLEYLPTEKPVIHLIRENSVGQNLFGQKVTKGYYKTHNLEELKSNLDLLLVENNDYLKDVRLKTIKDDLYQPKNGVSNYIVDYITNVLS